MLNLAFNLSGFGAVHWILIAAGVLGVVFIIWKLAMGNTPSLDDDSGEAGREEMKASILQGIGAIEHAFEDVQAGDLDKANRLLDAAAAGTDGVGAALDAAKSGDKAKMHEIMGAVDEMQGTVERHIGNEAAIGATREDVEAEIRNVKNVAGLPPKAAEASTRAPAVELRSDETTDDKMRIIERYFEMAHPQSDMESMLGLPQTRPEYRATAAGEIARSSSHMQDMKIVSTAKMLRGRSVNLQDPNATARAAMEVVTHYASKPDVKTLFLMPYHVRIGQVIIGADIPKTEICRLYTAVENMLIEIYEDLPEGGLITDAAVDAKVEEIVGRAGSSG